MAAEWGSRGRRIIVIGLAVFGGLQLAFDGVRYVLAEDGEAPPVRGVSFPSPGGNYKAVMFKWDGGSGPAYYCFQFLSVVPVEFSEAQAWKETNRVVESGCEGISNVIWKSNSLIEIKINPTLGASNIDKMLLKGFAQSGSVEIGYAE